MKRKISLVLIFSLLLCSIFTNGALAASATPTASTILIDGKTVGFDAYLIGGNNFIKLRDLSYSLSGTKAQFDVSWDGHSIILSSGKAYTPVGGEMSSKGKEIRDAEPSNLAVIKDGVRIPMSAYSIGGNNYFKLRDIAQIIDFSVEWSDGKVVIDTGKPYVMPSVSSLALNSYALLLVGMTKAQIDAKLGTPTIGQRSDAYYQNGLMLAFDVQGLGDVPTDSNRCTYVSGHVNNIISGCPASLTLSEIRSLFGSGDVTYDEMDDVYVIRINYGNVPLFIDCDKNGSVTPDSDFYYNINNVYTAPTVDYSWAEREWSYSNAEKFDPTDRYPTGDEVSVKIKEASKDKLTFDGIYTRWYGTSCVIASVDNITLTSSDGKTYKAYGVEDSWYNTVDITIELEENRLILHSELVKTAEMVRCVFFGDYTLA